nr:ASN_HP1_G0000770.mRNA.1.CDS.1 [Saccharomyces cerevisiae]
MLGTWPLLEEEKQLVYWIRQEASKGATVFACLEGRSKSCIIKYGATCVNRRQRRGAAVFLNRDEKSAGNGRQRRIRSLWKRSRKLRVFQRLRSHDEPLDCRVSQYVKLQFSAGIINSWGADMN